MHNAKLSRVRHLVKQPVDEQMRRLQFSLTMLPRHQAGDGHWLVFQMAAR